MANHAADKILAAAQTNLKLSYDKILLRLDCAKRTSLATFIERILDWYVDKEKHQWLWETFHKAIDVSDLGFFGSLNSFVGNCLLDDSYFLIEWRKPDYKVKTMVLPSGKTFFHNEIQWIDNGELKTILTSKEDPEGKPVVVWSSGDDPKDSQNVSLLLEAMDIVEEREIKRKREMEKLQELFGKEIHAK